MRVWRAALRVFGQARLVVNSRLKLAVDVQRAGLGSSLAALVGGNVRGLCTKTEGEAAAGDPRDRLMCLECESSSLEGSGDTQLACRECGSSYPVSGGVVRMLPAALERELYAG
jgi:hypothetical protein